MTPEVWREHGETVRVPEGDVFVIDRRGRADALPIFVLHGFPTSSWDFAECVGSMGHDHRIVLFDFPGFGFSDKPANHAYSLFEQADVACAVAKAKGLSRVVLWAHDMGTSVAAELCARRERGLLPFEIATLVLMNGSVHMEMASLTVGQRLLASPAGKLFARLSRERVFQAQMRRVFAKPPRAEVLHAMWVLLSRGEGTQRLPTLVGYMAERRRFAHRWIGALDRLDVPTLIAWGERDPVAVLPIAERLAREIATATLVTWPDLGHYPQVEDPERVARTVLDFTRAQR